MYDNTFYFAVISGTAYTSMVGDINIVGHPAKDYHNRNVRLITTDFMSAMLKCNPTGRVLVYDASGKYVESIYNNFRNLDDYKRYIGDSWFQNNEDQLKRTFKRINLEYKLGRTNPVPFREALSRTFRIDSSCTVDGYIANRNGGYAFIKDLNDSMLVLR